MTKHAHTLIGQEICLPVYASAIDLEHVICDAEGAVIATASGDYRLAIVTALNAHDAMLEVLKKLDGHLSILVGNIQGSAKIDHRWEGMEHIVRGWRDDIKAVTAKAEGGAS